MPTIESALMDVLQLISRKLDMILEEIKKHPEPIKEKEVCKCCHYLNGDVIPKLNMPAGWNVCPVCGREL